MTALVKRDWTRLPLGAARPDLIKRISSASRLLQLDAPAWVIDENLKLIEESIRAFRDNER